MAPYAIAHFKISLKLYETGYLFKSDKRDRVYLTPLGPRDGGGKYDQEKSVLHGGDRQSTL